MGYNGVGYGPGPGKPPAIVPIPLKDSSGNPYLLTLGEYDEQAAGNVQNTAQLLLAPPSVPEASTTASFGLLLALGLGRLVAAKRRKAPASS